MTLYESMKRRIDVACRLRTMMRNGSISEKEVIDDLQVIGMTHDEIMSFLFDMVPKRRPFWRFWGPRTYVPRISA